MDLKTYLSHERGLSAKLARDMGVTPVSIFQWAGFNPTNARPVPVERCPVIERATQGAVTRRDLRPADWWEIWPELVTDEFPIPRKAA